MIFYESDVDPKGVHFTFTPRETQLIFQQNDAKCFKTQGKLITQK